MTISGPHFIDAIMHIADRNKAVNRSCEQGHAGLLLLPPLHDVQSMYRPCFLSAWLASHLFSSLVPETGTRAMWIQSRLVASTTCAVRVAGSMSERRVFAGPALRSDMGFCLSGNLSPRTKRKNGIAV